MSKLTLDALKERVEAVASEDLLNSISGGTENACHCSCDDPGAVSDGVGQDHTFHKY